jgi:hypothetical protein
MERHTQEIWEELYDKINVTGLPDATAVMGH